MSGQWNENDSTLSGKWHKVNQCLDCQTIITADTNDYPQSTGSFFDTDSAGEGYFTKFYECKVCHRDARKVTTLTPDGCLRVRQ